MPFAPTWMDLEIVILSEVSQRQISDITYIWSLKKRMIPMNLFTKETYRKQMFGYQSENGRGIK